MHASTTKWAMRRPRLTLGLCVAFALAAATVAVLPSVWPATFPFLHPARVDTDPENMLPVDEPVRVFHNRMQEVFDLHEMVVVGIVNEQHPDGVFTPASLGRIHELTTFARTLRWEDRARPGEMRGVVSVDVIAPGTVDSIEPGGPGEVRFEWLMPEAPQTTEAALAVRAKAMRIPFLNGTMVSENGKALCLYLPVTSKDVSYRVSTALRKKVAELGGDDTVLITGLPVANDTFGVEMFIQMAISAPLAMLVIFLLMLAFFRKPLLIVSPMLVALLSVIITMGALIATGHTVHIMSSMIPIFIMPIAVLDSVHILSEFFDRYPRTRDRERTVRAVMHELFLPMLYTTLTSMAGFASLALTPNPPVQVFGVFVALGVFAAWLITILLIPAYIMLIPDSKLEGFGAVPHTGGGTGGLGGLLQRVGGATYRRARTILLGTVAISIVAAYGITRIEINDNPVLWFTKSHPIRVADTILNRNFGGTYMAYLTLEAQGEGRATEPFVHAVERNLHAWEASRTDATAPAESLRAVLAAARAGGHSPAAILADLDRAMADGLDDAEEDAIPVWEAARAFVDDQGDLVEVFKSPQVLRWIESLQAHLLELDTVGKVNSLPDVVKTVHRELFESAPEAYRIPDTAQAVAQCLITYQGSHRPQDLWHLVTPDYRRTLLWVQLRSGNNRDMSATVRRVEAFVAANPPPVRIAHDWFGLAYINVVWQQRMVEGMLQAFVGSFLVVFLMMALLFRSALWGGLAMLPLSVTILFMYGLVGLVGKDYDMPIAVLSSLTLGLAVDFAIHFLVRSRAVMAEGRVWRDACGVMFDEPARAITRNIVVVAVGFTPLLLAPLVPYRTVGIFMATILLVAGLATLLLLPALLRLLERPAFCDASEQGFWGRCGNRLVIALAAVLAVGVNFRQALQVGWTQITWVALAIVIVLLVLCRRASLRGAADACPPGAGRSEP